METTTEQGTTPAQAEPKQELAPDRLMVVCDGRSLLWPDRKLRGLGSRRDPKEPSRFTVPLAVRANDPFIGSFGYNLRERKPGEKVFVQPEEDYPPFFAKELRRLRGIEVASKADKSSKDKAADKIKGRDKGAGGSVPKLED